MKKFAFLMVFVSFSSFGAVIDGCFKTLSYNGETVVQGPDEERSLTRIYSITSEYYYDQSLKPLKTKVVSIFKGFNEGWYSYINPILFDDFGVTNESDTTWTYSFEGEVKYRSSYYSYEKADFLTDVQFHWGEDGLLYGKVYQLTKALDRESNFDVVLAKSPCPID